VERHKNDATDADAICEAVTRPNTRFVATKTPEQQSCLTLHRTCHLFIRQQAVICQLRPHETSLPRRARAVAHTPMSCSRPTKPVIREARTASKRLSDPDKPSTARASMGSASP
jgi:hypothetical protein